jgi:Uma2 family endonuclease
MTAGTRLTFEEFLALPETEPPSEYICGEVIQKPTPSPDHGRLVIALGAMLFNYLQKSGEGEAMAEARHAQRDERRVYLPDISVVRRERIPTDPEVRRRGPLEIIPDLAIEVLSPDDRPNRVAEKLAFCLRAGVPLTWIIDSDERSLYAYRPGQPSSYHVAPEVIGAAPVLSAFEIDLGKLFSVLEQPR